MVMAIMRARTMGSAGRKRIGARPLRRPIEGVGKHRVSWCRNLRMFRAYMRTPIPKERTMRAGPACFWLVGAHQPDVKVGLYVRASENYPLQFTRYDRKRIGRSDEFFCSRQLLSLQCTYINIVINFLQFKIKNKQI